jgi:hypothetical protein
VSVYLVRIALVVDVLVIGPCDDTLYVVRTVIRACRIGFRAWLLVLVVLSRLGSSLFGFDRCSTLCYSLRRCVCWDLSELAGGANYLFSSTITASFCLYYES